MIGAPIATSAVIDDGAAAVAAVVVAVHCRGFNSCGVRDAPAFVVGPVPERTLLGGFGRVITFTEGGFGLGPRRDGTRMFTPSLRDNIGPKALRLSSGAF